jgi:hypothetical protein
MWHCDSVSDVEDSCDASLQVPPPATPMWGRIVIRDD